MFQNIWSALYSKTIKYSNVFLIKRLSIQMLLINTLQPHRTQVENAKSEYLFYNHFVTSNQILCCDHSLESSRRDDSNEWSHQRVRLINNRASIFSSPPSVSVVSVSHQSISEYVNEANIYSEFYENFIPTYYLLNANISFSNQGSS